MTTDLLAELVPTMPPISMAAIVSIAEEVLQMIAPDALAHATSLDVAELIDKRLQAVGIFVYPASWEELGDRLGATFPDGTGTTILLSEETWQHAFGSGRRANQARATFAHEFSHAIIHAPILRTRLKDPRLRVLALSRVRRDQVEAFRDPEWQAWALAGCLLAHHTALARVPTNSLESVSDHFGMSTTFMRSHLRRVKMEGRFPAR